MTSRTERSPRRETLNIRIPAAVRALIDRAAEVGGKTRTDFILEASKRAAEETLIDQTLLLADPKAYAAFVALLEAPPAPNERLRRTMRNRAPWDLG
ncbi:MAG TPA: DUF1778 domain-containing protein [Variovorax sp.]|jgi:uncharacterized protein (DUF1778 family)